MSNGLPVILIIGATGHVGKNTISSLKSDKGSSKFTIKAGVRNLETAKAGLDSFGIDLVYLDLDKPETFEPALKGVNKVFLILSYNYKGIQYVKEITEAAKAAKVEHFAFLSIIGCEKKPESFPFIKQFREAEEYIENSGLTWTFLRCSFFQENCVTFASIIKEGKLILGARDVKVAPVSVKDVGEAAANILLGRISDHASKIYQLTGPELLSGDEMATIFSKVLTKEIKFCCLTKQEIKDYCMELGYSEYADRIVVFLEFLSTNQQALVSVNEKLLGKPATKLEDTIYLHKDHFFGRPCSTVP